MGQYHFVVNLDRKEFLEPHRLGSGRKLQEQMAVHPGAGAALLVLLASASNGQGAGDLVIAPIVGSWRGDRIAMVGDYDDASAYVVGHPRRPHANDVMSGARIFAACQDRGSEWKDVSDAVCAVLANVGAVS